MYLNVRVLKCTMFAIIKFSFNFNYSRLTSASLNNEVTHTYWFPRSRLVLGNYFYVLILFFKKDSKKKIENEELINR